MVRSTAPRPSFFLVARFASVNCFSMNTMSCFIVVSLNRLETGPARQPRILNAAFDDWLEAGRERPAAEPLPALRLTVLQLGPF